MISQNKIISYIKSIYDINLNIFKSDDLTIYYSNNHTNFPQSSMSYRQPSFAGGHSQYNRMGASNLSRPGFTPTRNFKQDNSMHSFGQLEHLLQKERQKYRQTKEKMEYDIDNERKNRIECENKLIRLKDQINQRDNRISQFQFRENGILHKLEDTHIENQKMRIELSRMEDLYSHKIHELETELAEKTKEYDEFNEQCSLEFDNFKKEGNQYIQAMKFQHQRLKKVFEDKLRLSQNTKRDLQVENKRLVDLIQQNKLLYQEQIRESSNRIRDEENKKAHLQSKSFDQRIKNLEEARDSLHKKNLDLMKQNQDKDRFIQEIQREKVNELQRARSEISDLMAKNNQLNMLYEKVRNQLVQKSNQITQNTGGNQQQIVYLKQQIQQKRKELDFKDSTIRDLKQQIKDISTNYQRSRSQLNDKCNYFQSQARKNKDLYTKLTQTLKAKINQTITNVSYK